MTDMSGFEGASGGGSTELMRKKYDPHQTYSKLVEKRQLDLAKNALYEKQALQLTKRFMIQKEEMDREKNEKKAELEHQLYEKTMKKVQEQVAAEQLLEKMVKEEKSQITAMMREKDEKKAQLEEEKKAAEEQKMWFIHGRRKYEKLQADERKGKEGEETEKLKARIAEREERHAEFLKECKGENDTAFKESIKKREVSMAKVDERRKASEVESLKQKKEQYSQAEERRKAAEQRRKEVQAKTVQSVRDRKEVQQRWLTDRQDDLQKERRQLHDNLVEKEEHINQRVEDMQIELQEQREEKAQRRYESRYAKWMTRLENDETRAKELAQKIEDKHSKPVLSVLSSVQSEMNDENVKAQKEYVRLRNELERQEYKMKTKKKFKDVTEKADSLDEGGGDPKCVPSRVTRMRALFNMYFAEKQTPKDSINYEKLNDKKKLKVFGIRKIRCGLCEMDYISDNLPGIATRATIQKLRKGWMSKTDDPQLRGGTGGEQAVESPREGENGSGAPSSAMLYDKVRLCAFCFQFVRQHNRQQTSK